MIKSVLLLLTILFGCTGLLAAQQEKPSRPPEPLQASASDFLPKTWKDYLTLEGRFKARFPGKPTKFSYAFPTAMGDITLHQVLFNSAITYAVAYSDYPIDIENSEQLKTFLENAKAGGLARLSKEKPEIVRDMEISVDGHPGKFVQLALGGAVMRIQYIAVFNRIYMVSVGVPKGRPNIPREENDYEQIALSFFDSFKLFQLTNAQMSGQMKEVSSPAGRFKILFPGTPTQFSYEMELPSGKTPLRGSSYQSTIIFTAMYADMADIKEHPVKWYMDEIRLGELDSVKAMGLTYKILGETDISIDGYPGRFLRLELSNDTIYRRTLVIADDRMYVINAVAPIEDEVASAAKNSNKHLSMKFIESFKLIPQSQRK